MRVVLDALPLQVRSAGIAAYTDGLVRSLAAQHPEVEFALFGLPARLLGERGGSRAPYPANVRWITTLAYPLVTGTPIMGLPRLVRLERVLGAPTLYHATNYAAPRARAVPLVLTVHDLALLRAPELGTPSLRRLLANLPSAARAAARLIADSEATARDLRELLGVPAERIRVVHLGCDARFRPVEDSPARRAVLQRYGILEPYLLHVGTIEPRKNLPALVRAFARLCAGRRQPPRLVLAGARAWGDAALRRALAAEDPHLPIAVVGPVAADDLPALYSAADLFVYPSLYEGFGLPVLEAMACGTAVVTSDAGALPEVVGDAARTIAAHDGEALIAALRELLDDPAQRRALGARGRARAASFTWARCAAETFAVYEEVARTDRGSRLTT
jgi:glycosyltransferase involved in cell wall biosynthesis